MKKITSSNRKNNPARITKAAKEKFYAQGWADEERFSNEILAAKTERLRTALLERYYPAEYFQSPPSESLVAYWVESRNNLSAAKTTAEKQFWTYQKEGFTGEISRRLNEHPISRLVLNTIYECPGCYEKLLQFAKFARLVKDPNSIIAENTSYRVGAVVARERKQAEKKKALVKGVFDEDIGKLKPQYALIAAACDGFFDYFLLGVRNALIDELRERKKKRKPKELSLDSLIAKGRQLPDRSSESRDQPDSLTMDISEILTEKELKVITLMYPFGMTQQETAKSLNISQPRVQAIHKAAIGKIKKFYKF